MNIRNVQIISLPFRLVSLKGEARVQDLGNDMLRNLIILSNCETVRDKLDS